MKWEDFAQYIADHGEEYKKNLDGHFHPISADCNPCSVPFNYIVKLATFNEGKNLLCFGFNYVSYKN